MAIAKVEPLLTTRSVSGPFDYRLPEAMGDVGVGSVLVVPFGRRKVVGVVVGLAERSDLPDGRLAEPLEALEAGVPPELVELGRWVGEEYCSTTGRGLGLVLPPGVGTGAEARRVRPLVELEVEATPEGIEAVEGGERLGLRQKAVLRALLAGPQLARRLTATAGSDRATLRRLEARGLVRTREVERRRRHSSPGVGAVHEGIELTSDQQAALRAVVASLPEQGSAPGGASYPAPRGDRLRQDRGLPRGGSGDARARERGDRPGSRDRPDPADHGPLPPALRRLRRSAPFQDAGRRQLRRMAAPAGGRGSHLRRPALGGLRADRRSWPDRDRRGARLLVQAGERSALRRPRGGPPPGRRRRVGPALRDRHPAAGELA